MTDGLWTVDLPRTAAAWRSGARSSVEAVLLDELVCQASDLVDDACSDSGGWPEDEQVDLEAVEITDHRLTAAVTVHFVESIPSSCKDMPYHESRERRLILVMERGNEFASVALSDSDADGWEVADRNSAADGT